MDKALWLSVEQYVKRLFIQGRACVDMVQKRLMREGGIVKCNEVYKSSRQFLLLSIGFGRESHLYSFSWILIKVGSLLRSPYIEVTTISIPKTRVFGSNMFEWNKMNSDSTRRVKEFLFLIQLVQFSLKMNSININ